MIIQCPACSTKYVVPDTAIGVDGRTVRCAKCRHSWFQDGPELDLAEVALGEPEQPSPPPAAPSPPPPPPPVDQARAPVAREEPVVEEAPPPNVDVVRPPRRRAGPAEPPVYDDAPSAFDAEPPFRPRRNWLKVWTWAGGIFALIAAGLIFAVSYWGLPDWVPVDRPDFAAGDPDLQLDFPPDQQERRTLPNGTEFFGASGTITNIGTEVRTIPSILIVLRDQRDRKVYDWVVAPPQRTIAPGESVPVREAVTDIPRSAREVQIGWKPE